MSFKLINLQNLNGIALVTIVSLALGGSWSFAGPLEATYESIKTNIIDVKCLKCHKAGGKAEDIPFETKDQLLKGNIDDGPLIVPGKSTSSAFFQVMSADTNIRGDLKKMPPPKAVAAGTVPDLTPEDLQVVEAWINAGANR